MGVFEEIRNWLSPEIKELKAKLENLEKNVSTLSEDLNELEDVKERLSALEAMSSNLLKGVKELKDNQLRSEEKLSEMFRMLLEVVRLITKLEDKIDLERRVERLEEAVLKKR